MIGNEDIFDSEELLAIANDGGDGSSSSSCHSSAESEEEENESPRLHSPSFASAVERKEATASNAHPSDTVCDGKVAAPTNSIKETDKNTSNKQTETTPAPKGHADENSVPNGSDSDDSSDDDGFLESWFETEKRKSVSHTLKDSTDEEKDIGTPIEESANDVKKSVDRGNETNGIQLLADAVATQEDKAIASPIEAKTDNGEKNNDHGKKRIEIELGASVLQWISSANNSDAGAAAPTFSSGCHGGVVALEHNIDGEDNGAISRSSALRLTATNLPADSPRKRSRSGNKLLAEATLEEVPSPGSTTEGISKKNCRVTHVSRAERMSTSGAMVDCLARYDSRRGCYVLEMVDLLVDKIVPPPEAVEVSIATAATELFDPRSVAKRAEDQLKKLKRGKGRTGTSKKKRVKTGAASS